MAATHLVTWLEAGRNFDAAEDETILAAAERAHVRLPSECTFGACGACRVKIVEGAVHYDQMPDGLSADEHAEGFALMCQAYTSAPLVVSTDRPLPSPVETTRQNAVVQSIVRLSPDVYGLSLSIPGMPALAFRPGQYLHIHAARLAPRSFSMANASGSATLELQIRQIAGGHFTEEQLPLLHQGATLDIEWPLGGFGYHEDDYRAIVMLATGTGIAPLWSMLQTLLPDPDRPPIDLFWGARTEADLYLLDTLQAKAREYPDFTFTPVLSRPDDAWTGVRGYVQDAVTAMHADLSEHAVYACGSPAMIAAAKDALAACGASMRYFYADGFTFQHIADAPALTQPACG